MMNISDLLSELSPAEVQCKGTFYRYTCTAYKTKRGFATTQTVYKLARMSCPGCNQCGGIDECISMELSEMENFPIILPDGIQNGDIIKPYIVTLGHDWETGYSDDWEIRAMVVNLSKLEQQ